MTAAERQADEVGDEIGVAGREAEAAVPLPAKVDPETLALRGTPRRVARFRREIIIGVAAVGALAIATVTWIALEPVSFKLAASGDEMFEKGQAKPPEALAGTPGRDDEIPKLGPPLPGDLGRPILEHQRKMDSAYPTVDPAVDRAAKMEEERERRAAEEMAARQSAVMMSVGAGKGTAAPSLPAPALPGSEATSPAGTASTTVAASNISQHRIAEPASPWLVSSGSVIAASLVTGLNSDLPGLVVAQVSENVFDSVTGRTLLIPQGARIIGRYGSNASYGQQRAFVVWQRIIWPNGSGPPRMGLFTAGARRLPQASGFPWRTRPGTRGCPMRTQTITSFRSNPGSSWENMLLRERCSTSRSWFEP